MVDLEGGETIATAITAAEAAFATYICVGPGTTYEAVLLPKEMTLKSLRGSSETTIDAGGLSAGVHISDFGGAYNAVQGFTITGSSDYGIFIADISSYLLTDVSVVGNGDGGQWDAGISANSVPGVMTDVQVRDNHGGDGAGIYTAARVTMTRVRITGNVASGSGGGIYTRADIHAVGLEVIGNSTDVAGGGILLDGGSLDATQAIIAGNTAGTSGGAVSGAGAASSLTLTSATVVGNTAADVGGIDGNNVTADLTNVILAFNEGGSGGGYDTGSVGSASTSYCDFYQNTPTDSPSASDPPSTDYFTLAPDFVLFSSAVDPLDWDLHLRPDSGLVNAGDTSGGTDPDGSNVDIGAFGGPGADFGYYGDADSDGLYDGWEAAFGVSSPTDDPDGDGLTNAEELTMGTDPTAADTDGDGVGDGAEASAETDPLDEDAF